MGTLPIHAPPPDNKLLIATFQVAIITETVAVLLNILLLSLFYRQVRKNRAKIDKYKSHEAIWVTWVLLFVGFGFSVCQGLLENWLTPDCGVAWLQWATFFFYTLHRSLLLFSFLHRLRFVFKNSAYAYPEAFYTVSFVVISINFVASFIIYGVDYGITYVDISMWTGLSGSIICSWNFGLLFTTIARPAEIILTFILIVAFLYKLWKLNQNTKKVITAKTSQLLVIFRKITWLTICAIFSTVIVTFGYINYKPLVTLFSLDVVFNSFCVFLMFQFNQSFIRPCFGTDCNHCCCLKCDGCCKCRLICGEVTGIVNTVASMTNSVNKSEESVPKPTSSLEPPETDLELETVTCTVNSTNLSEPTPNLVKVNSLSSAPPVPDASGKPVTPTDV
jgi:hypothetical protein